MVVLKGRFAIIPAVLLGHYTWPVKVLNARPSEVKAYLVGQLNSNKLSEFNKEIYKLGVI